MVTQRAPAKVNLFLHVAGVKPNGRHDLDSLVVFADNAAADRVRIKAADRLSLGVIGPNATGLETGADNIVMQAGEALKRVADVSAGAAIELTKHLPLAAGIGGGSADAGATLRGLCRLWGISEEHAEAVAPGLGGDVPAALLSASCLMRGEGERIVPVALPAPLPALLVNPGVPCATGPVFTAFDDAGGGKGFAEIEWPEFSRGEVGRAALMTWLNQQTNDLELAARQVQPAVADVLDALTALDGVMLTRMSGSGATCFAIFGSVEEASAARMELTASRPEWWARATLLGGEAEC